MATLAAVSVAATSAAAEHSVEGEDLVVVSMVVEEAVVDSTAEAEAGFMAEAAEAADEGKSCKQALHRATSESFIVSKIFWTASGSAAPRRFSYAKAVSSLRSATAVQIWVAALPRCVLCG